MSGTRRSTFVSLGVFVFLTFLVWGFFALDRGMFQDDVCILAQVYSWGHRIVRFFYPVTTPTRVFAGTPFGLALLTPWPVETLQIFYGLTWLAGGVFATLVLAQVFPGRAWLAFTGGCLTICATSDYLTDSLVALHYEVSSLFYVVMLVCLLRWLRTGKRRWLALGTAALAVSLGNTDVAFAPIMLTPALLWLIEGRFSWGVKTASLGIACVFGPYAVVFLRFLVDPHSYAAIAMEPLSFAARAHRVGAAYLHNFAPWSWGRARGNWFPALPPALPGWIRLWGPVSGVLAFLSGSAWIRGSERRDAAAAPEARTRDFLFLAAFLAMALACNSTQGILTYSQFFYRTQVLSRYWASLAVALAADMLLRSRAAATRRMAILLPLLLVGFGVDGGLDRQDYYLAYWKRHRVELRSIVEAAPRLAPSASLVLHIPRPVPYFAATQADYLAQAWTSLLYDDPSMFDRMTLISPYGDQRCSVEAAQLVCRSPQGKPLENVPLSRAVILSYDEIQHRYALADEIPAELYSDSIVRRSAYNPRSMIVEAPLTSMARRVLLENRK
jgi:hypothetical protein